MRPNRARDLGTWRKEERERWGGGTVGTCSREQNDDDTIFSSQGTLGARPATKSPFCLSCRSPLTPFNSEMYKYFSEHTHVRATYCHRMNHGHLFSPSPVNEYRASHPLNLSSSLPHFIRWGPYSSLLPFLCNIKCSLFPPLFLSFFFSKSSRDFSTFFNILSVLVVLQYYLCSSPPPRLQPLELLAVAPISRPLFVHQSFLPVFFFLSHDLV